MHYKHGEFLKTAHRFYVDDLSLFLANLQARRYMRGRSLKEADKRVYYSRILSGVMVKYYSYDEDSQRRPIEVSVSYHLTHHGKPLWMITKKLKLLNTRYRQTFPERKTKRAMSQKVRERRWAAIQRFLKHHSALIECFKYQADNRLTEGSLSFNMEIASNPREQALCFEFIKALVDAYAPQGIIRAHREPDVPRKQRNGWIKRYALRYKKKGWTPFEISKEIQKELRTGAWNERSRLQYNLAPNTICRIAGIKLQAVTHYSTTYRAHA